MKSLALIPPRLILAQHSAQFNTWSGVWELLVQVPDAKFIGRARNRNSLAKLCKALVVLRVQTRLNSGLVWMSKSSVFCKADDKLSMFSVIKIDKMKCPMVIAFLTVEGSLTSKHLAVIPDESVS